MNASKRSGRRVDARRAWSRRGWLCGAIAVLGAVDAQSAEHVLAITPRLRAEVARQRATQPSAGASAAKAEATMIVLPVLLAPDEKLVAVQAHFPVHVLTTGFYHDYAIAQIGIAAEDAGEIDAAAPILLQTVPAAPARRLQRPAQARRDAWRHELERLVMNAGMLSSYAEAIASPRLESPGTWSPTQRPSLEGSAVEMLIVTREILREAYQIYADERTGMGVPTVVRTLEWIESNYPHGADPQETLRLFLREAYALWGLHSVLLGGDTDVVPTRYVHSTYVLPPAEVPTDLYYACLDGTWNEDGDALWGEAYDPFSEDDGDNADLYPELYIGRLPMRSASEVASYRAKLASYIQPTVTDYQDKVLFLAEVLWPSNYTAGGPIIKNGADNAERLIALNDLDTGNLAAGICPQRIAQSYEVGSDYPGSGPLLRQAAIDSMNAGFGLVTHIGHGFRYTMSLGDASLTNIQAAGLTNASKPFFLVMLNCTASAYDFPCLAEQFILNPQGGAIGVLGAAREAYPDGSQLYLEGLFRGLFDNARTSVGQAVQEARLELLSGVAIDGVLRWTNFITAYLGDPTLMLWRCAPLAPTVTHASALMPGQQQFNVQVTSAQGPVVGGTVCLWKTGDFYAVGTTNTNGVATLVFRAEAPGNATLRVVGAGIAPYQANVSFATTPSAILRATGNWQVTDSGPGTIGNGNGNLEAGETALVALEVRNTGSSAATNIQLAASTSDPFLVIQDPFVNIPSLAAGQTVWAPALSMRLGKTAPDLHHVELQVNLAIQGKSWSDHVALDVLQVRPQLVGLTSVDGDGDGFPAAGESYTLQVQFKNYGFARLDAASATLSSTDADVTITDASATVGNVARLSTGVAEFQLAEANVIQTNPLHIVLTSGTRTWAFDVETRRPGAPASLATDASGGPDRVHLTWAASTEPDIAGYHVYRASTANGPWTRADADLVTSGSYFGSHGLAGSTTYHFAVTAVDESGNESPRSAVVAATTNPIQNAGWPRLMRQWTSNSPVAADVDGDGVLEVFAGADVVYAWHADGSEITDGDADASTDGVFSNLGQGFTAGLAAGNLDGDAEDEIVACSWDTREIFAFDGDGDVLPGWPRMLAVSTHGIWATPAIADVDLDGNPDVIVLGLDGRLYVWRANGQELRDGDANPSTNGVFFVIPSPATWSRGAPAVANLLPADAGTEIIFGTTSNRIYVLRADGSVPPGWPVTVGDDVTAAPAIGDVNGDGTLEVVVPAQDGFLYVLRNNGTALPGWPRALESQWSSLTPSVALHDFDGDGKLEIVAAGSSGATEDGLLAIFDWQGNFLPGWPVEIQTASEASPVLGDLDGDGEVEIVFGGESGMILGYEPDGSIAPGFPIRLGAEMRGTPSITDVNGDGGVDLVVAGWDQLVYVFDFPGDYAPGLVPWGTFKGNPQRTSGYYPATPTDAAPPALSPLRTRLHVNTPNPFNPQTRIAFDLAGTAPRPVRLSIHDAQGRHVRLLVDATLDPGPHARFWDGRDDTGRDVASGVYFTRLATAALTTSRKMLLLR